MPTSVIDIAAECRGQFPDEWLSALANGRRLILIDELRSASTPIATRTVARRIAAREEDTVIDAVDPSKTKEVLVSLHHNHLPRLQDVGLIEYDERNGMIEEFHVSSLSQSGIRR